MFYFLSEVCVDKSFSERSSGLSEIYMAQKEKGSCQCVRGQGRITGARRQVGRGEKSVKGFQGTQEGEL